MYEEFTQNRIAQLRMQKNVSARDMSLTLGQNNSYINQIENKKALPSLQGLFYICEYFGITPQQFFDDGNAYPVQLADLVEDMKKAGRRLAGAYRGDCERNGRQQIISCAMQESRDKTESSCSPSCPYFLRPPLDKVSRS